MNPRRRIPFLASVALLAVGACGSSMSGPDTAQYRQLATSISAAATAHRDAMATMTGTIDCQAERDRYRAQVTPLMDRMQEMSGDMDGCMESMGHASDASMRASCTSMRDELNRHYGAACASATPRDNAAEASAHADRMTGWANTEAGQADRMHSMMGGSGMMGGGACRM